MDFLFGGLFWGMIIVLFGAKITKFLAKTSGQTVKEINKFKKDFKSTVEDDKSSTSQ